MDEKWLPVFGYEGFYEVSNRGRVRSIHREGIYAGRWRPCRMTFPARDMRLSTQSGGYKYCTLRLPDQEPVKHLIHRLVMRAFVGTPPADRYQVNHIDGIKENNHLDNLEYCSAQENLLHLTRTLKRKIGGAGGYSKLTKEQALSVLTDKRTLKAIAADYGVTLQAIWLIRKGKNWPHLQPALEVHA